MSNIKISFPDGSKKEFEKGIKGIDIAKSISEGLARASYAMYINNNLTDIYDPIEQDSEIKFITEKDEEGKDILKHSCAHLFAHALLRKYPKVKIAIGPAIKEGFHYDFKLDKKITPEELPEIEQEMKKIVDKKLDIRKEEIPKNEALELFKDNPFKKEMIEELDQNKIRIYKQGDFVDFCRGPHVPNTGMIKAFKLTKISGAYWKGNSNNEQLQRVYGIAFPDKKELKEYIKLREEAEKRDHRKIGKELEIYSFHDEAPGMPFFHDKGSFIWNKLHNYVKGLMRKRGYEINKTPIILNKSLWLQSGHWDHYKENMYFTKIDSKEENYAVKPMNCPGNILVYKTNIHSYRDLPIRAGEFGLVHRHELSGVLSGLFRVRCFTQDDAHVFCTEDQIKDEVKELLDFIDEIYSTFDFEYHMELSTRPEKAMGDSNLWELAEKKLKEVLDETGKEYIINEGDGAFYGPKIDFHLKDAIGRTWQCGTIQLDFQMPEKFDLTYENEESKKERPVMLHRAILGSVERFMGILIEHYAGKFPLWISPAQVKLLPIADRHIDYCRKIVKDMKDKGIMVDIDEKQATVNKKIRNSQLDKVNYILVVGDKEMENKTINIRTRDEEQLGEKPVDEFIDQVIEEIKEKK